MTRQQRRQQERKARKGRVDYPPESILVANVSKSGRVYTKLRKVDRSPTINTKDRKAKMFNEMLEKLT